MQPGRINVTFPAKRLFFHLLRVEGGGTIRNMRPRRKVPFMLAVLLASVSIAASSPAPQQKSDATAKIIALENKWNEAYKQGDVALMDSLLADDFIITVEEGLTFSKVGYLAHSGNSDNKVLISEVSDLKVRFHGEVAIVIGAYHEKGISNGRSYEYHDRLTDVWMLMPGGRWQVIASHYAIPAK
ncbi:MAG TPA: nuclear transport factor 2 family protein [Candidatus Acidoferrum sp.]|nr:nuclear transport factor 2 family protein [Candidatus Acidoferrum sp.]